VIDVCREVGVRIGIVERLAKEDRVDGFRGGLDTSRASKIFAEGFPDEVPERHPARPGCLGSASVEVRWEQELGPVHV
jgi:hypothetical protein